jgi:hypothetical protein
MSETDKWFRFDFTAEEHETEAVLSVQSATSQREIRGKDAIKLWKKIVDIADQFPGPTIIAGLVGR